MKKSIYYVVMAAACLLIGATACSDGDTQVEVPDFPDVPGSASGPSEDVRFEEPVFVSDGIRTDVRNAMQNYLTNITGLDEAKAAVVTPGDLGRYDGALADLFDRGGLVIIVAPTGENFDQYRSHYAVFETLPFDATQSVLVFAADRTGTTYVLYADGPGEARETDDTYYGRRIYNFFRMVRHDRMSAQDDTRAATVSAGMVGAVDRTHVRRICQNFEINLDKAVYSKGSIDYNLAASGSVDVVHRVLPIYSYGINMGEAGDYYFVETEVTVHNEDLYVPYVVRGNIGNVFVGGYFMREMGFTTGLKSDAPSGELRYTLTSQPTPASSRQGPFECRYRCRLTGPQSYGQGLRGGEVGFYTNIDQSTTWGSPNLAIDMQTESDGEVSYTYTVQDIDFSSSPIDYDYLKQAIPAPAREELTTHNAWVWRVPTDQNQIGDNSEVKMVITNEMSMTYGSYYYKLLSDKGEKTWTVPAIMSNVSIGAPDRRPFGIVSIKNNHKGQITDLSFVRITAEGKVEAESDIPVRTIAPGETGSIALVEGTYDILYAVTDADGEGTACYMQKKGVSVSLGTSSDESTVSLTSDDFSVVPASFPGLNDYTDGGNPLDK